MPRKVVVRKVKGGKLFRLSVELPPSMPDVKLDGDLFIHPEERMEDLEAWLCRCLSMEEEASARRFLQSKLDEGSIKIVGADSAELVSALWEAKA